MKITSCLLFVLLFQLNSNNAFSQATDCNGTIGGSATLDSCEVCSGGKTGIVPNSSCGPIAGFTIIEATGDTVVTGLNPMSYGAEINLNHLKSDKLNFIVNASTDTAYSIGSIKIELDSGLATRTESAAPYSLPGDQGGVTYNAWKAVLGKHFLKATAYSGSGGMGTELGSSHITFYITDCDSITCLDCFGDLDGGAIIDSCGNCTAGNTGIASVLEVTQCRGTQNTGILEQAKSQFSFYPNPATESVTISSSSSGAFFYNILGLDGQLFQSGISRGQTQVNVSELKNGIYFIEVEVDGFHEVYKLVKQ